MADIMFVLLQNIYLNQIKQCFLRTSKTIGRKKAEQKEKAEKTPKNWIPGWGKVLHLAELEDERTEFFNSFWGMHYSRRIIKKY